MRKGIDIIKQVKEKLGKSADAGDYIDDFKKSDAPQFKGKSDKKKEKMAVAAYLDSKEEVEIKEMDLLITTKDDRTSDEVSKFLKSLSGGSGSKNTNKFGWPQPNKYDIEGVEVIKPKKINVMFDSSANVMPFKVKKELEKKFRNNIKVVMEEVKEEKRQLKDPKKEAMVMKVKDSGSIQVIDKKDLEKYLRKGYIQVEDNIQEALKINYVLVDTSKNNEVIAMSNDEQGVKDSMRTATLPPLKVKNKSSLKIVKLKRPKGDNMAGKLIGEPLKSWGEETDIQESGHTDVASMKTQVQIATDALQKMNTELGKLSDEEDLPTWWTNKVATAVSKLDGMADYIGAKQNMGKTMKEEYKSLNESAIGCLQTAMIDNNKSLKKESKMGELFLDMQMDAQEMDERDFVKMYTKKGFQAAELKSLYKEFSEEVVKEDNITEETVFVVRFEKEGMRFATPFHNMKNAKDGEKILKKSSGVSNITITKDVLKPGIFLNNPVKEGVIVKEENLSVNLMEFDGTITIDTKNSSISKQLAYHLRYDLPSEFDVPLEMDGGEQGDTHFFMSPDMDNRDVKKFAAYLKKKYGNSIKLQLEGVEQVQEVLDNSLMAQATRVISQTAIKEKLDPLDVDNVATQDDRKAADKNIIIQLRRAQDMKGRADVTFKDNPKKKVKIDINIINKALNMFDSMKPNDKIKMQTTIGKSYRDLLNTVKRGR